jgi:anti-sigma B factor antagonist
MCGIWTKERDGVLILGMSGRLTILDQKLRNAVSHFLKTGQRDFILEMKDVSYIDSCGLGELVTVYTSIRNCGGRVRFLNPSGRVRQLLSTTKLDTVFEIITERAFDITPPPFFAVETDAVRE